MSVRAVSGSEFLVALFRADGLAEGVEVCFTSRR
jgi:hypothetical protein